MTVRLCKDHWLSFKAELKASGLAVRAKSEADAFKVMEYVADKGTGDAVARDAVFNPDPGVDAYMKLLRNYGYGVGVWHAALATYCPLCKLDSVGDETSTASFVCGIVAEEVQTARMRGEVPTIQ